MDFENAQLLEWLETASPEDMNGLPFGVVRTDLQGKVTHYSRWESQFSGLESAGVVGRNFFTDVAPCSNNYLIAHVFTEPGAIEKSLDYVFTYKLRPTRVQLRLLRAEGSEHQYLAVRLR